MVEQLAGVASVAAVVLAYLLLVEAMMAAIVLLATFIVLQWRQLWALLAEPPRPPVSEAPTGEAPPYRLGGGLARWE